MRASVLMLLSLIAAPASARVIGVERLIDFESDGDGNPFTAASNIITFHEYDDVAIVSGFNGINFVVESNPIDQNPFIEGYHLNVGATIAIPLTFLEIHTRARDVSFDFATFSGQIQLLVFDPRGRLFWFAFLQGLDFIPFTNRAGFPLISGGVDFRELGINREMGHLQIRSFNQGLVLDNLRFTPTPEPGSFLLLLIALGMIHTVRRR